MFKIENTELPGVHILSLPHSSDARGSFVKVFHLPKFRDLGLRTDFTEQFFTVSKQNALRGMHCQSPPYAHAKLVTCVAGLILDVVLDLRRNSSTFGRSIAFSLHADESRAIYIPPGCAHGFLTISHQAITYYNVTSVYDPVHDVGVHWDSIGFDWPVTTPIVSTRDEALPTLDSFQSPFQQQNP